jgi:hypothetical protein
MRHLLLGLTAAAVVVLPTAAASADYGTSSCGAVNGGFENTIRAVGVSCTKARSVARKWHTKAVDQGQGPGRKYVGSYLCTSHSTDAEHVKVSCAYGARKVRFFAGP